MPVPAAVDGATRPAPWASETAGTSATQPQPALLNGVPLIRRTGDPPPVAQRATAPGPTWPPGSPGGAVPGFGLGVPDGVPVTVRLLDASTAPAVPAVQRIATAPAADPQPPPDHGGAPPAQGSAASGTAGTAPSGPGGTAGPGTPGAAGAGAAAEPEELLKKLFDPLLRRLKTELRLDRERHGALTDRY